jgi:leucyl aminopeptidase
MRPGDIYYSQNGKSVEIANTDAEGRLLLADALERAKFYNPSMVVDFATLTGAARVALGEDLPAYFTNNENIAKQIDELNNNKLLCWRLPLYRPYLNKIKSRVADISNASLDGMAGSITAALFLQEFISFKAPWVHFDTFGWSNGSYLGTHGGALQGLDLMLSLIQKNYK